MVKVVTAGREWNGRTKDKRKSTEETKSATLFSSSCCFMWSAMNLTPMTACITFDGRMLGRRRLIDGSSSSLRTASPLPSDLTDDCCHHRITLSLCMFDHAFHDRCVDLACFVLLMVLHANTYMYCLYLSNPTNIEKARHTED